MSRKHLLLGISLAAMAATGLNAQNTQTVNNTGTNNNFGVSNSGATNSDARITINGDYNSAYISQNGDNESARITITGDNNSSTIEQYGDDDTAVISQTRTDNSSASIYQYRDMASATISQVDADGAYATITQGNWYDAADTMQSASITQSGVGNSNSASIYQSYYANGSTATISQSGSASDNDATIDQYSKSSIAAISQTGADSANSAYIKQDSDYYSEFAGDDAVGSNFASITQNGSNSARILQGNYYYNGESYTQETADHASATVTQTGTGNSATLLQGAAGEYYSTLAGDNVRGKASIAQTGENGTAYIVQAGTDNSASVGTSGANNFAVVAQRSGVSSSTGVASVGGATTGGLGVDANVAAVEQRSGSRNNAYAFVGSTSGSIPGGSNQIGQIVQDGSNNNADVTVYGGAPGNNTGAATTDPTYNRSGGNRAGVQQTGDGNTAFVVIGSVVRNGAATPGTGVGNSATVTQTGNSVGMPNAKGATSTVWQQGRFGSTTITQTQTAAAGTVNYGSGTFGRPNAAVYQAGTLFNASVTQTDDNIADVTQGLGTIGSVTVYQVDMGDQTSSTALDPFGNPAQVRTMNTATVVQYGNANTATVEQTTIAGNVTAWQKTGSSGNDLAVYQGRGLTASTSFTPAPVVLSGSPPAGASTRNLVANVTQAASGNGARVRQDGVNLTATIDQAGTGTALNGSSFAGAYATDHTGNIVQISQQGTNNTATATQTSTVGRSSGVTAVASGQSGDAYYFAGGARSPEIDILQSGANNRATVTQAGKGQYARIEQSGTAGPGITTPGGNTATIDQQANATNATAVIVQTGNNNTYSVTQTLAGQYITVNQTGNANAATSIVQRGPGS